MSDPRVLLIVGAALGSGRWLADNLLASVPWARVILVDSDITKTSLRDQDWRFEAVPEFGRSVATDGTTSFLRLDDDVPIALPARDLVAVVAVPSAASGSVVQAIARRSPAAQIFVAGHSMASTLQRAGEVPDSVELYGIHPLLDLATATLDGQIIYVASRTARPRHLPRLEWLHGAVVASGGIFEFGTADEHDETMKIVQALSHQTLIAFADAVTRSDLDLESRLWASRTPLFETLFGLAARVLDPRQQSVIVGIQGDVGTDGPAVRLARAVGELRELEGDRDALAAHLSQIRDRFSGSLFDAIRGTAAIAIGAAQAKRADLARVLRTRAIVGLRRAKTPGRVHVGRIVDLSTTHVTLEELLVGRRGSASLLDGPGLDNARRIGTKGAVSVTTFALGQVQLLDPAELEDHLEQWLGSVVRDVRVLVPESVSGSGVLAVFEADGRARKCSLVDEVVRTGQRSVVINVHIRVDRDVDETVEGLRERASQAYGWPRGLVNRVMTDVEEIVYLGPAGSFSELAARSCAISIGAPDAPLVERPRFEEVLGQVRPGVLGVLPISSSASGLVSRAVGAVLSAGRPVVAGGMVDVAVRFDAYVPRDVELEDLRGAVVFSHPQAIAQCSRFIETWDLQPVEVDSTSAALGRLVGSVRPAVALAGAGQGANLPIRVARREVDDLSGSITRFLIVGDAAAFGESAVGSDPTVRSLWVGDSVSDLIRLLEGGGAAIDELVRDDDGRFLLVSSRAPDQVGVGARFLGQVPWSPRTPIVRAGSMR
jgi:prephenate dehydratase/prephenate dehydrogenase